MAGKKAPKQSEPNKGGRPTDLTPEVIDQVVDVLPIVMYLETVADYIGVHRFVFRRWLKRGVQEAKRISKGHPPEPREAIYMMLSDAVKKAMAQGIRDDCQAICKARDSQWQAAAWRLERRLPDMWGRDRGTILELEARVKAMEEARPASPTLPEVKDS